MIGFGVLFFDRSGKVFPGAARDTLQTAVAVRGFGGAGGASGVRPLVLPRGGADRSGRCGGRAGQVRPAAFFNFSDLLEGALCLDAQWSGGQ